MTHNNSQNINISESQSNYLEIFSKKKKSKYHRDQVYRNN